ncbi:Vng0682c [Halorubrum sp. DM2]|uniref:helix-hairpin-helix domain-containing protein n=1 Tax=Halorubrum sp. DM2 TaxID=2527867 RepID=UPI0024B78C96|nr:helix-hairpin-helix domain-containing protein [Halorubrum sp. DM2]VTT86502.1 Vng0682c [Halorubrum sp. DM2]
MDDEPADRTKSAAADRESDELVDLKWIGPATEEVLSDAGLTAAAVREKGVSYRALVDAGVNPGVAAKIRREHSLSWSFEAGDGLDRRSTQVRGLGSEEAAWVAASAGDWASDGSGSEGDTDDGADSTTGDWEPAGDWPSVGGADDATPEDDVAAADGSGDPVAAEAAWRTRSAPTPLSTLSVVADDGNAVDLLADAGISSVRSLAAADPDRIADVLDLDAARVGRWHAAARDARN